MNDFKTTASFQAQLNATKEEQNASMNFYEIPSKEGPLWELIIQYRGDLSSLSAYSERIKIYPLTYPYAILLCPKEIISTLIQDPMIIYAEFPHNLYYEEYLKEPEESSCLFSSTKNKYTGDGILLGVIDSGIDAFHPEFIDASGQSRIEYYYDEGSDTIYDNANITQALLEQSPLPTDLSGHGTHVTAIAAGNHGIAPGCRLLIVKLAPSTETGFFNTAQLLRGIHFCVTKALQLQKPLVINLSIGNSYGSHSGTSLIENYLDDISTLGPINIVVGTGNNGTSNLHCGGKSSERMELAIGQYEISANLQFWKFPWEKTELIFAGPDKKPYPISNIPGTYRHLIDENTYLYITVGTATPYSSFQEIYLFLCPQKNYITSGIYQLQVNCPSPLYYGWNVWLNSATSNEQTVFLTPTSDTTLTIPSTSRRAISVGSYNSFTQTPSYFSGRGYPFGNQYIKPEFVAPGENITSAAPQFSYETRTGTSMATPFVSGACCLYMDYGITQRNDPYLYGEKLKARLITDSQPLPGQKERPNPWMGWGKLCIRLN